MADLVVMIDMDSSTIDDDAWMMKSSTSPANGHGACMECARRRTMLHMHLPWRPWTVSSFQGVWCGDDEVYVRGLLIKRTLEEDYESTSKINKFVSSPWELWPG